MKIQIAPDANKEEAFKDVKDMLNGYNIPIDTIDATRPWGGFFCISESGTQKFIDTFFKDVPVSSIKTSEKLSPKILLVEKGKRLSWQFHHRRAEIWRVIGGTVQVVISDNDEQTEPLQKNVNDVIILQKGQRHRLIGNEHWGIIAEIWQHSEPHHPSDEDDIVRVEDDFGR